ncbi:hypothetical protein EI200_20785 [Peribacillus simplex]|uniref:hypothetical protein n=1 Tax=Peribacillus simplex TaxID=1478 RepID=UPI000F62C96E|nr:hypothetical protein [Peribacillus simplex]RRN68136.1 hypothetical protein EI200_20785 [Peribacillus simplex]
MNYTFKKNCYKPIQAVMLEVSVLGLAACGATKEEAAPVFSGSKFVNPERMKSPFVLKFYN